MSDRFWGKSSPFSVLDTKNLSYLTLDNSVADMVHFAKSVKLPFDKNSSSNAPQAVCGLTPALSRHLETDMHRSSPGSTWAAATAVHSPPG